MTRAEERIAALERALGLNGSSQPAYAPRYLAAVA